MDIGIIGSGSIGATGARLFAGTGHDVAISNSRGPKTLEGLVEDIGARARAVTVDEAADFGEVVLVAIPFLAYETLPADRLADKIVVDAMNYYPDRDGEMDFDGLGSSELLARHLPNTRIAKAFNTMYYATLGSGGRPDAPPEERLVLFVAGDDAEAKAVVSGLIEEIGFSPVDVGSLKDGRTQQPGSPVYNVPMNEERASEMLAELDREGTT